MEGLSTLKSYSNAELAATNDNQSPLSRTNQSSSVNLAASAPSPFRLTALKQSKKGGANDDIGLRSSKNFSATGSVMAENPELRKIWQNVLRECHRADPDRTGQINRNTFIAAIERGDLGKVSLLLPFLRLFLISLICCISLY